MEKQVELKPEYPAQIGDTDVLSGAADNKTGVVEPTVTPGSDEGETLTTDERLAKLEGENTQLQTNYTNVKTAMQQERTKRHASDQAMNQAQAALKAKQVEEEVIGDLEDDEPVPVGTVKKLSETNRVYTEEQLLTRDLKIGGELSRTRHDDFDEVVGPQMDEIEARMSSDPEYVKQVLAGDKDPLHFVEHVYQTLKAQKAEVKKPTDLNAIKVAEKVTNPVEGPKLMTVEKAPVAEGGTKKEDLSDLETARRLMRLGKITQEDLDAQWS